MITFTLRDQQKALWECDSCKEQMVSAIVDIHRIMHSLDEIATALRAFRKLVK